MLSSEESSRPEGNTPRTTTSESETQALNHKRTRRMTYEESMDMELTAESTGQKQVTLENFGGIKVWGTEADLDENAYGAGAVAIIRDFTKLLIEREQKGVLWSARVITFMRLAICLALMLVNLGFQGIILAYIRMYVVMPAVQKVQLLYKHFHKHAFDDFGEFQLGLWEAWDDKHAFCQITQSNKIFYFGILLIWTLLMMTELRIVHRVMMDVWEIRPAQKYDEMLDFVTTNDYELGGNCLIIGITPGIRTSVILFVCIPRLVIGFTLFLLGLEWLSASTSFADMTLHAMALEFVKNIDDILYEGVLPYQLRNYVAETNIFKIQKRFTRKDLNHQEWCGYRRTVMWMVIMFGALFLYSAVFQTVLPFNLHSMSSICRDEVLESRSQLCNSPTWSGWNKDCYKYGA